MRKLSFAGTGHLGSEVVRRILQQNQSVYVWNRSPEKAAALTEDGALFCHSFAELVSAGDVIMMMLTDFPAYRDVFSDLSPGALAGKMVLQMGTISKTESQQLAEMTKKLGGNYAEAPVLGSKPEARNGALIVLFAGAKTVYEECLPIFNLFSDNINYFPELGQAAVFKLALNQLIAAQTASIAFSLNLLATNNMDTEAFMQVVRNSALYAPTFDKKLENYRHSNYDSPNFPLRHLLKDVQLMIDSGNASGVDTKILEAIAEVIRQAMSKKLGDKDYSALYEGFKR
jgi:3-hydroxyisobutyrate dehydrogenase